MADYYDCPTCHRTRSSSGRSDMRVSRCGSCGYVGCWNSSGISSVGCWTKPACPRCGKSGTAEQIGWLA